MDKFISYVKSPYSIGTILLIGILTAISGELKVTPFNEMSIRFGFGSIVFFIALLMRPVPIVPTGLVTGGIVWVFRTILDFFQTNEFQLLENLPAAIFYVVFASGLTYFNIEKWRSNPLKLGLIGAILELVANGIELLLHMYLLNELLLNPKEYSAILFVAMLRSFFVVGLYSTFVVREQKKREEQLLNMHSNLYVEAQYVEKMMQNIEEVTADCFELYRTLQQNKDDSSMQALQIAQSIHEVKKDAERLNAGLSKIVHSQHTEQYVIEELLELVKKANEQYANSLQKNITVHTYWTENVVIQQHYLLLALLNNIVANAVEAIENSGNVYIKVQKESEILQIIIKNSGPQIEQALLEVIFDPGYTTKFNSRGIASTGIGLSHVKSIVAQLNGTLDVKSEDMTVFIMRLPIENV